ncbi:Flp pilus assembly complex ATPase component TadA [Proteiniclasticum sp. BAD-10]|uniref:Flp pilus assembly complex ATPase component TadA n=1 Tax=Proteiniclasticum sediminis TaxID=2804028 RepID=A0A941CPU6_9CLOT|nr:ATPase, T2SS/T4P/T4SS family [Proteiniclasticum sediminis]MBR0575193.1 Flp pilus assembly complex ATPase component TadA [Proteiniclasticum sediminis]
MASRKRLGEILESEGLLSAAQTQEALEIQRRTEEKLGDILVSQGWVTYEEILQAIKRQLNIPLVDLDEIHIKQEIIRLMPEKLARKYSALPVRLDNGQLLVAMGDPSNYFAIDDLRLATGYVVKPAIAAQDQVSRHIDKYYDKEKAQKAAEVFQRSVVMSRNQQEKLETELNQDAPIIQFINTVLENAILYKASDIHIEPEEEKIRVRYRIDGYLEEVLRSDIQLMDPVVSIIKIMCNMNISEKRVPQDGRFLYRTGAKDVDMRVSIVPTINGEKIVLRLLNKDEALLDLGKLGFSDRDGEIIQKIIRRPYGMVLLCGPTGSGKTTTLYSFIKEVNDERKNIVTIEDPVEYNLDGVNQMQVNNKIGFTFAEGLRSILRQDPDIVLVGEIRDMETAEIAIRAALTGHLVFSTLHTNNAVSTISRLKDMNIQPFLLASTLGGIIAQRLVRKVCPHCAVEEKTSPVEQKILGLPEAVTIKKATGCPACNMKGYKGRLAIYEVLVMDEEIQRMIVEDESDQTIETYARQQGMISLRESCVEKVLSGETTLEELVRTIL